MPSQELEWNKIRLVPTRPLADLIGNRREGYGGVSTYDVHASQALHVKA